MEELKVCWWAPKPDSKLVSEQVWEQVSSDLNSLEEVPQPRSGTSLSLKERKLFGPLIEFLIDRLNFDRLNFDHKGEKSTEVTVAPLI